MEIGELVKVIDGSYSLIRINGKIQSSSGTKLMGMGDWKVVATNQNLPTEPSVVPNNEQVNDTIIEAYDGTLAFIQERFLVPVNPRWKKLKANLKPSIFSTHDKQPLLYSLMVTGFKVA